jgi:DNA invertase Pin-like site-specific DNA recombinase
MIVERVHAGLRRVKAQGKTLCRPRVTPKVEARIRRELGQGIGVKTTARKVGVSVGTVQRVKAAA